MLKINGELEFFRRDIKKFHAVIDEIPLPQALQEKLKLVHSENQAWIKKHQAIFGTKAEILVHEAFWCPESQLIDHSATALKLIRRLIKEENDFEFAFHLATIYCFRGIAIEIWKKFTEFVQLMYLAERLHKFDPIVIFWTGICGGKPWLSDSYLVRAFYWAAEHNYVEALRFFFGFIAQERQEVFHFRSSRAFQLAANYGNIDIINSLWTLTDEAQHKKMIQAVLYSTPGNSLR